MNTEYQFNTEYFMEKLFDIKMLHESNGIKTPPCVMISCKTLDDITKTALKENKPFYFLERDTSLYNIEDEKKVREFVSYTMRGLMLEFKFIPCRNFPDNHVAVLYPIQQI